VDIDFERAELDVVEDMVVGLEEALLDIEIEAVTGRLFDVELDAEILLKLAEVGVTGFEAEELVLLVTALLLLVEAATLWLLDDTILDELLDVTTPNV